MDVQETSGVVVGASSLPSEIIDINHPSNQSEEQRVEGVKRMLDGETGRNSGIEIGEGFDMFAGWNNGTDALDSNDTLEEGGESTQSRVVGSGVEDSIEMTGSTTTHPKEDFNPFKLTPEEITNFKMHHYEKTRILIEDFNELLKMATAWHHNLPKANPWSTETGPGKGQDANYDDFLDTQDVPVQPSVFVGDWEKKIDPKWPHADVLARVVKQQRRPTEKERKADRGFGWVLCDFFNDIIFNLGRMPGNTPEEWMWFLFSKTHTYDTSSYDAFERNVTSGVDFTAIDYETRTCLIKQFMQIKPFDSVEQLQELQVYVKKPLEMDRRWLCDGLLPSDRKAVVENAFARERKTSTDIESLSSYNGLFRHFNTTYIKKHIGDLNPLLQKLTHSVLCDGWLTTLSALPDIPELYHLYTTQICIRDYSGKKPNTSSAKHPPAIDRLYVKEASTIRELSKDERQEVSNGVFVTLQCQKVFKYSVTETRVLRCESTSAKIEDGNATLSFFFYVTGDENTSHSTDLAGTHKTDALLTLQLCHGRTKHTVVSSMTTHLTAKKVATVHGIHTTTDEVRREYNRLLCVCRTTWIDKIVTVKTPKKVDMQRPTLDAPYVRTLSPVTKLSNVASIDPSAMILSEIQFKRDYLPCICAKKKHLATMSGLLFPHAIAKIDGASTDIVFCNSTVLIELVVRAPGSDDAIAGKVIRASTRSVDAGNAELHVVCDMIRLRDGEVAPMEVFLLSAVTCSKLYQNAFRLIPSLGKKAVKFAGAEKVAFRIQSADPTLAQTLTYTSDPFMVYADNYAANGDILDFTEVYRARQVLTLPQPKLTCRTDDFKAPRPAQDGDGADVRMVPIDIHRELKRQMEELRSENKRMKAANESRKVNDEKIRHAGTAIIAQLSYLGPVAQTIAERLKSDVLWQMVTDDGELHSSANTQPDTLKSVFYIRTENTQSALRLSEAITQNKRIRCKKLLLPALMLGTDARLSFIAEMKDNHNIAWKMSTVCESEDCITSPPAVSASKRAAGYMTILRNEKPTTEGTNTFEGTIDELRKVAFHPNALTMRSKIRVKLSSAHASDDEFPPLFSVAFEVVSKEKARPRPDTGVS